LQGKQGQAANLVTPLPSQYQTAQTAQKPMDTQLATKYPNPVTPYITSNMTPIAGYPR